MEKLLPKKKGKILVIIVSTLLASYFGLAIFLRLYQARLMFFPSEVISRKPEDINIIRYENVWISVGQQKLNAWWFPSSEPDRPVLLYLHGNASNLGDLLEVVKFFRQLNISFLLIDYRGYGYSKGNFPKEKSLYEDGEAAWNYLVNEQGIKPQNILVFGHSLGGAIAIELALNHPDMKGVIIEASFTSMKDMVNYFVPLPIYPLNWLLTEHFDSINKVKSLKVPIFFIHGTLDKVVPYYMSKKLYKASSSPKSLLLIPNAAHNNLIQIGGEQYRQAILAFINTP